MESSPAKKRKNRGKSSEDEGLFGSDKQQHKLKRLYKNEKPPHVIVAEVS